MAQYGKAQYWDERYTNDPESFDWYQRYAGLSDLLAKYIKKDDGVLMVREPFLYNFLIGGLWKFADDRGHG